MPLPPFGRLGQRVLGDWSVAVLVSARLAAPVEVFFMRDLGFGPFNFHPDLVSGVPLYLSDSSFPDGRAFNREAFAIPETARQGTLGRNALRGFPAAQLDLSLRRGFALAERL